MSQITECMNQALSHHQAGRLQKAEALYRMVLGRVPGHADALHLVGLLAHQQGRYETAAWVLLWRPLVGALFPSLRERGLRNLKLKVPKWHHLSPLDKSRYPEIARGQWLPWKPREAAERIRADFARLRALADRHGVRLFVVNLPEGSWTLKLHRRERFYADYFAVVQEALGEVPFVNLRRYLEDDEFYDWSHPTRAGAERLTDRLAVFLGKEGLAP